MFRKIRDGAKRWILIVSSGMMLFAQAACERERALTLTEETAAQKAETCLDLVVDRLMRSAETVYNLPSRFMSLQFDALEDTIGSPIVRTGNEAHDCQRLFGKSDEEGPLAGVYALKDLENANYNSLTLVAAVLSEGTYTGLGIGIGRNCLFVRGGNGSLDGLTWEAYMVWAPQTKCEDVNPDQATNITPLKVARVVDDNNGQWGNTPPKAARWEDRNGQYYIAFQCQNFFCFVGTEDKGKPPRNFNGDKHARGDEQYLAVKDGITGKWRRSKLRANLRPKKDLADWNDTTYFRTPREVATLHWFGGPPDPEAEAKYNNKFGSTKGNIGVSLKYVAATDTWWVEYSTKPGAFYKVIYEKGSMKSGRGTTRFLWSETDEKLWIQCAAGCCGASN